MRIYNYAPCAGLFHAALRSSDDRGWDTVICWLTGYDLPGLQSQLDAGVSHEVFYGEAPQIHPNADKITGTICGHRVEGITDPLMKNIRRLD
jgi:hypothetical protein